MVAALQAANLGAKTTLVTQNEFGGMAANDGPVPVRTLAHAARLIRDVKQFRQYGIDVGEPKLDFTALLSRVRDVVNDVRAHSAFRMQVDSVGITVHEQTGATRFVDPHTLETESGLSLRADRVIICTGGASRRLSVPGAELTATHSDAWSLTSVPESILVIGAGATGAQVASVFNAFGSRIQLFQTGPRILPMEDEDVSRAVAAAFRESGIVIYEDFGRIESFEKTPDGVRMHYVKDGLKSSAEASLAVVTAGWVAKTETLNLRAAGVETDLRGFVCVNAFQQTSAPHIFAAGDVTGGLMLVPQAIQEGYIAGTNAVRESDMTTGDQITPIGSFTDPEYAQVGLTQSKACEAHDVLCVVVGFDSTTRTIIDGRTFGFCKLLVDRATYKILGCHVVGERAVEITQVAAIAIAAGMRVDDLARVPLSFPTYAGIVGRLAASATRELNLKLDGLTALPE